MKRLKFPVVVCLIGFLIACASKVSPAATSTSQSIEISTQESIPPKETIPGLSVAVRKPDEQLLVDALNPFANAFKLTSEQSEKVKQGLQFIELKDKDGNTFIAAVTPNIPQTIGFDKSGIPLLIADLDLITGEWGWSQTTLRKLAEKAGIRLGVLIPSTDQRILDVVGEQFNEVIIWIAMDYSQPTQGQFDYTSLQYYGQFAINKNMTITAMPIIWQETVPEWILNGGFNKDQLTAIMTNHIGQMVSTYQQVDSWVVVNEPYNPPYITNDIFAKTMGIYYIDVAFQTARDANSSAKLIFNNDNNYTPDGIMTSYTKDVVSRLKSKGLVDLVGVEMHINASKSLKTEDIIKTLQSYPVPVVITELDVNLSTVVGSKQDKLLLQAQIYQDVINACLKSGSCNDIRIWGFNDNNSVWEAIRNQPDSDPLLFEDDYSPKPAFWAVMKALLNNPTL